MYFASENGETLIDVVNTDVSGINIEIQITKTFFAYDETVYAKKHNHAFFEVFINKNSSGVMFIEDKALEFTSGSLIVIAPKVYHSYRPNGDKEQFKDNYNLKFMAEGNMYLSDTMNKLNYLYVEDASEIINIVEKIQTAYETKDFAFNQEIKSLFTIMMIHILRHMTGKVDNHNEQPVPLKSNSQIAEIEDFFEGHYDSFPAPSELAKQLNVSTRQLDRILKTLFSMSFSYKLALTKIELAKDLITTTDISVAELSEKLGYASAASFSSTFKKLTGFSPNNYRKSNTVKGRAI